jgi:hypothetical protein
MIRIIRTKDTSSGLAGEILDFDSGNRYADASDATTFLWGADLENYLIFRDGLLRKYDDGNLDFIEEDLARIN